jgi:rhamnulokinase
MRYRQVFGNLKNLAPFPIEKMHIIGGGSVNKLLSQFSCNAMGVSCCCGPREATALGNILVQAKAAGLASKFGEVVRNSVEVTEYYPEQQSAWKDAYDIYLRVCKP